MFEVEVSRNEQMYHMEFERGKTTKKARSHRQIQKTGTLITFLPDKEIFRETVEFKTNIIAQRLRELAFLNSGWKSFSPTSGRRRRAETFYYKNGVEEFVKQLNKSKEPLHPKPIAFRKETKEKLDDKDIEVHIEVVLQYNDSYNDQVLCYTNTIHNPDAARISPASAARSLAPSINTDSRTNC